MQPVQPPMQPGDGQQDKIVAVLGEQRTSSSLSEGTVGMNKVSGELSAATAAPGGGAFKGAAAPALFGPTVQMQEQTSAQQTQTRQMFVSLQQGGLPAWSEGPRAWHALPDPAPDQAVMAQPIQEDPLEAILLLLAQQGTDPKVSAASFGRCVLY
jgi:hypothetical protein